MRKRYLVDLTDEENATLRELVRKGTRSARTRTRAHILLQATDGASDQHIADALHIGRATVERVRKRFVEGNLDRARTAAKRPGAKRKLDGKQEALLVATACSTPPHGRARWTMQLLADTLLTLTEQLSEEELTTPNRYSWISGDKPLYAAFLGGWYEHDQEHLVYYYLDRHDLARAITLRERCANRVIQAQVPEWVKGSFLYNLACFYAQQNLLEKASALLQEAVTLAPRLQARAMNDPDLKALREQSA